MNSKCVITLLKVSPYWKAIAYQITDFSSLEVLKKLKVINLIPV